MGNGGQHAIATAAAAKVCLEYDITPRQICDNHLEELQKTVENHHSRAPCATLTGRERREP